jgi:hypothetical protein
MIITTYQEATDWLAKGRKKWERPMYFRGLRLRKSIAPGGNIEVFYPWANQSLVVFHPDDTLTIQCQQTRTTWGGYWNPLYSWSVRESIRYISGVRGLYKKNNKFHIVFSDAQLTPVKIQKCRACSGSGLVDGWCSPNYCYDSEDCDTTTIIDSNNRRGYHYHQCTHGNNTGHPLVKSNSCYNCNGTGKKDYGSKLVSMLWDGSPLRLQNGTLVNNKPSELEKAIAAYVPEHIS